MNEPKAQQDPSMEEILASIRRIISEGEQSEDDASADDAPEQAAEPETADPDPEPVEPPDAAEETDDSAEVDPEEVLELTEKVEDDGTVVSLNAGAATEVEYEVDLVEEDTAPSLPEPEREVGPSTTIDEDRLVSDEAAAVSADAFSELSRSIAASGAPESGMRLGGSDRTIEDVVREAVRPLLKDWLDRNLPGLVQKLVQDEIRRLSGN